MLLLKYADTAAVNRRRALAGFWQEAQLDADTAA